MFGALLITLREGLEAALIVGIVLGALRKMNQSERSWLVWAGSALAIVVSVGSALALNAAGVVFTGRGEEIFEGVAMILAAGVLTWMIFWMQGQGKTMRAHLEQDTRIALDTGNSAMLFGLAFLAVVREGIETVLFLTAAAFGATPTQMLSGGGLGLVIAIGLGWLIFVAGEGLDLSAFFRATGVLLLLFSAGLLAHGVHELQEAMLLPVIIEHVWDVNAILDENGVVGSLLKALFGYNGNPSLIEVIAYLGYLLVIGTGSGAARLRDMNSAQPQAQSV